MNRRSPATSRSYAASPAPRLTGPSRRSGLTGLTGLTGFTGLLGLFGLLLAQGGLTSGLATFAAASAAVASVAAASLLCALLTGAAATLVLAPGRIRTAIRDRERRTAFLPQRDPDASGRPRPRAPGRPPRTATQALAPAH